MFNNAHSGSWTVFAEFQPFWFKCLAMMPRHTYILMNQKIYQGVFIDLTLLVQVLFRSSFFFATFSFNALMAPKKRCRQEESRPCFSQSQVLCAYHVLSLSPHWFVWPNTIFLAFIWPDIKTEVGVVIYMNLKHSPDFIDSKYIYIYWFVGPTP